MPPPCALVVPHLGRSFALPLHLAAALAAVRLAFTSLEAWAQAGRPAPRLAGRPTLSVPDFKNTVTQQTWWWQGLVAI
jgi:hypothetical protein